MQRRIFDVLLIASNYDNFMLEEDGRIEEQIFNEYMSLNLRYPPRITRVKSCSEALEMLHSRAFQLVIMMPNADSSDIFENSREVKKFFPEIKIVVLAMFSREFAEKIKCEDMSAIDYIFNWLGDADLFMAIIKLLEDEMNVDDDINSVGIQIILLVEDSSRFYSAYLPKIYKFIFSQSRAFVTEAPNEHERMLRMRGRPKVMLARNYEEAVKIYSHFSDNILGVISDVEFPKKNKSKKNAGIEFAAKIRKIDPFVPVIFQSSEDKNRKQCREISDYFINKSSKTLELELKEKVTDAFGFGDFIFRDPKTKAEIYKISSLKELMTDICNYKISDDSFFYHASRNDISRWLYSRAMFPLAKYLKKIHLENNEKDILKARKTIENTIKEYRKIKNKGVITIFNADRYDSFINFARIGNGALGGKARGLAFVDAVLKKNKLQDLYDDVQISIPRTVVICADLFDEFMQKNSLLEIAMSSEPDETILAHFLKADLPEILVNDLSVFIGKAAAPIAVRSSSILEDSHYQPFAGVYSTYMIPYLYNNKENSLKMLCDAVKAVYASVYFRNSKSYMLATQNIIDNEKMSVVLQEVVGSKYGMHYYPSFSGVARSLNFYPLGAEKTEDGVCNIALGLGKHIVDGGVTLRFSPKFPKKTLQTSTLKLALNSTQTSFCALDLANTIFQPQVNDGFNLLDLNITDAENENSLQFIASTLDVQNQTLVDNISIKGQRIITFNNILKHNVMPLAQIVSQILEMGEREMEHPVEIEFAVNIDHKRKMHQFYLLQIRPIVHNNNVLTENLEEIEQHDTIIYSPNALGHGIIDDVCDIIYVKTDNFDAADNPKIVGEIEAINSKFLQEGKNYVLVGPGRWGSSDFWLGIPVKWAQISAAKVIVECGLNDYRIDASQGTHFFQNLTSFGVGYFTINPYINEGYFDETYLQALAATTETEHLRHIHFEKPIEIKIDGQKGLGMVMKNDFLMNND
ncbi:MAG: phosphoenolpyruvate synthase [Prevotellaceae bacterium]|nr:phosphoenolpyruvate synthase [Prevotellaceae bacterium]